MIKSIAIFVGAMAAGLVAGASLAQEPPRGAQFPQGECTGVLCSTIGGSQAPQNQPRKSLFPEGQCGGVLCSAIGGSQAPAHAEAPPPCGGGLLCDMAPYGMGQPFVKPPVNEPRVSAVEPMPPPPAKIARHRHAAKARKSAEK